MARWRDDVEFVAAGIYCFQPYCVTGEMEAPANPLICPQFSVRFNDLDNIGITGRHFSGFIMLGIQVFNLPGAYKFFTEECVEFNYRWLTETLKIDPEEITFTEDVWAGGGNLGPCMEYFVGGLELGNMVFMQFKTSHSGELSDLPVKVIDVGIGLERIPWIVNGSPTSYIDVFGEAFSFLLNKTEVKMNKEIWDRFGEYSCQLNVDDAEDINKTWEKVAKLIGITMEEVQTAIAPLKDLYIVLDHTRTAMIIIQDGALPSNVGGGGNVRNIIRRTFAILHKNNLWDKIGGVDGLMQLFALHRKVLGSIYGPIDDFPSLRDIIDIEHKRWLNTEEEQKKKLMSIIKKNKGSLRLEDWIVAVTSFGIPADRVAEVSKSPIPPNLYYAIAEIQDRMVKQAAEVKYDTAGKPETENLYYVNHRMEEFDAKIIDIFKNKEEEGKGNNILIFNKSAFYPFSGGQMNDLGEITLLGKTYKMYNCEKVGPCVLHYIEPSLEGDSSTYKDQTVHCKIDVKRRNQLRIHHSSTHVIFASARKVLGPHVWQQGEKKTVEEAHLDISHYSGLTKEQEIEINNVANRIVASCKPVKKTMMGKPEAEKAYGFCLYQGGAIPGNQLRIVNIEDTDIEACCGTHVDNTGEIGYIKLLKSHRISGVVRLTFAACERALEEQKKDTEILNELCNKYGIEKAMILPTVERFFKENKSFKSNLNDLNRIILNYQIKSVCGSQNVLSFIQSDEEDPSLYFSFLNKYAQQLQESKRGVAFIWKCFLIGILGTPDLCDIQLIKDIIPKCILIPKEEVKSEVKVEEALEKKEGAEGKDAKNQKGGKQKAKELVVRNEVTFKDEDSKTKIQTKNLLHFSYGGLIDAKLAIEILRNIGFKPI